jgi:hypothetical protein
LPFFDSFAVAGAGVADVGFNGFALPSGMANKIAGLSGLPP